MKLIDSEYTSSVLDVVGNVFTVLIMLPVVVLAFIGTFIYYSIKFPIWWWKRRKGRKNSK
jgi:lipopolysaccharide/colanic/teichoic acid biosynthesis glycosyltransferase